MFFLHAIHNFRIIVARSVGEFLSREGKNDAGVFSARRRELAHVSVRQFQLRPFTPEIYSRRSFQNLSNVSTANARRNFQKVELAISRALDELRMSRTVF